MKMSRQEFMEWPNKLVTVLGMSGVGKTTLAMQLASDQWFHYSADYRIGTRYLGEPIMDNILEAAMQQPFLRDLIRSDSIYIRSNITFDHLKPVSVFLGKIGNPGLGGISKTEFIRRQHLHREAEVAAMQDVPYFVNRARTVYGYPHFLVDTGGSVCEMTDDEVWDDLAQRSVIVYLKADEAIEQRMLESAKKDPKPLFYQDAFLEKHLAQFMADHGIGRAEEIVPNEYVEWVFPFLVEHRKPLYERIADKYGYTIDAAKVRQLDSEQAVFELIAEQMEA